MRSVRWIGRDVYFVQHVFGMRTGRRCREVNKKLMPVRPKLPTTNILPLFAGLAVVWVSATTPAESQAERPVTASREGGTSNIYAQGYMDGLLSAMRLQGAPDADIRCLTRHLQENDAAQEPQQLDDDLVASMLAACTAEPANGVATEEEELLFREVIDNFNRDKGRFELRYGNKSVLISGPFKAFSISNASGERSLVIGQPGSANRAHEIHCRFDTMSDEQREKILSLRINELVTVRGVYAPGLNLDLNECVIESAEHETLN